MIQFVQSLVEDGEKLIRIQASNSLFNLNVVSTQLHAMQVLVPLLNLFIDRMVYNVLAIALKHRKYQ